MSSIPAPPTAGDRVLALVREIPTGRVVSYGDLARLTGLPAVFVGGVMARLSGDDDPWWRVVGADGTIRTFARDPAIGADQTRRLAGEGIPFDHDGRVRMTDARFEL